MVDRFEWLNLVKIDFNCGLSNGCFGWSSCVAKVLAAAFGFLSSGMGHLFSHAT